MSNTRKATPGSPLRQERFSSSQQFERGLMANLVARRCGILQVPSDRSFVYSLQMISHRPGGIQKFAADLVSTFSADVGTKTTIGESGAVGHEEDAALSFLNNCEHITLDQVEAAQAVSEAIEELCLNPAVQLGDFRPQGFPTLIARIRDLQELQSAAFLRGIVVTEVGQLISDTLDYTTETGCMSLVDGAARTGKTFAAKAWCQANSGRARYVQVPSTNDDIGFFRAIAKGIGVSIEWRLDKTQNFLTQRFALARSGAVNEENAS
jgi:hypothetical protein